MKLKKIWWKGLTGIVLIGSPIIAVSCDSTKEIVKIENIGLNEKNTNYIIRAEINNQVISNSILASRNKLVNNSNEYIYSKIIDKIKQNLPAEYKESDYYNKLKLSGNTFVFSLFRRTSKTQYEFFLPIKNVVKLNDLDEEIATHKASYNFNKSKTNEKSKILYKEIFSVDKKNISFTESKENDLFAKTDYAKFSYMGFKPQSFGKSVYEIEEIKVTNKVPKENKAAITSLALDAAKTEAISLLLEEPPKNLDVGNAFDQDFTNIKLEIDKTKEEINKVQKIANINKIKNNGNNNIQKLLNNYDAKIKNYTSHLESAKIYGFKIFPLILGKKQEDIISKDIQVPADFKKDDFLTGKNVKLKIRINKIETLNEETNEWTQAPPSSVVSNKTRVSIVWSTFYQKSIKSGSSIFDEQNNSLLGVPIFEEIKDLTKKSQTKILLINVEKNHDAITKANFSIDTFPKKVPLQLILTTTKVVTKIIPQNDASSTTANQAKVEQIHVDYEIIYKGQVFEKGTQDNHEFIFGNNLFIKGFDKSMSGMKKAEIKDIYVYFPLNYKETTLANKIVDFTINMKKLKKRLEINDENVKKFKLKNMEEVVDTKIKFDNWLEQKATQNVESKLFEDVLNSIIQNSSFEFNDFEINSESNRIISILIQQDRNLIAKINNNKEFRESFQSKVKIATFYKLKIKNAIKTFYNKINAQSQDKTEKSHSQKFEFLTSYVSQKIKE